MCKIFSVSSSIFTGHWTSRMTQYCHLKCHVMWYTTISKHLKKTPQNLSATFKFFSSEFSCFHHQFLIYIFRLCSILSPWKRSDCESARVFKNKLFFFLCVCKNVDPLYDECNAFLQPASRGTESFVAWLSRGFFTWLKLVEMHILDCLSCNQVIKCGLTSVLLLQEWKISWGDKRI